MLILLLHLGNVMALVQHVEYVPSTVYGETLRQQLQLVDTEETMTTTTTMMAAHCFHCNADSYNQRIPVLR